jgi:hypothetical protein
MRLDFPLSLLDQTVDIIIGQTGRNDAGTGFAPSGNQFALGLDCQRYLLIGGDAPAQELGRDVTGGNLNNFATGFHLIYPSFAGASIEFGNASSMA